MINLVSAVRRWARQPENSIRNGVKMGVKLYVAVAMLMFLIGFVTTIYQGMV